MRATQSPCLMALAMGGQGNPGVCSPNEPIGSSHHQWNRWLHGPSPAGLLKDLHAMHLFPQTGTLIVSLQRSCCFLLAYKHEERSLLLYAAQNIFKPLLRASVVALHGKQVSGI